MKIIFNLFRPKTALYFILLLAVLLLNNACQPSARRMVKYNRPSIDDKVLFSSDTVSASTAPFHFAEKPYYEPLPDINYWVKEGLSDQYKSAEEFMIRNKTSSFLVIRNDSILYENYFNGYSRDEPVIIFSVSKSIVTALTGIALNEGHFKSLQQPIADFIPSFANDERRAITLEHLLQMTSGIKMEDRKNIVKLGILYYNENTEDFINKVKLKYKPGSRFAYKSIDTQILGLCLEKATGRRLADYLREKLWQPMGMECDAYITLDRPNGRARSYGGIAACARDLAKIGRLYLNNGNWNGKQLVPSEWVTRSTTICKDTGWWGYSTGWWLDTYFGENLFSKQDFTAAGYSGQRVYVNPDDNTIIIRQGNSEKGVNWSAICARLSALLNNCSPRNCVTNPINNNAFAGTYGKLGQRFKISRKGPNRWVVSTGFGLFRTKLHTEAPQSLFNKRRQHRYIFETDSSHAKVVGVYFDNLRKMTYYERVSENASAPNPDK